MIVIITMKLDILLIYIWKVIQKLLDQEIKEYIPNSILELESETISIMQRGKKYF